MITKKLIAEFLGAFILSLVVILSLNTNNIPLPTPVLAGLTLGLFVYTIGAISGCHINPAVTLGLLSIGKIDFGQAIKYIIAQIIGGLFALELVRILGIEVHAVNFQNLQNVLMGEIIGTSVLSFGVTAVVIGKIADGAKGIVIGTSLFLGASLAMMVSAPGFLNPAVAIAANSITISTLIGPVIGSILGSQLYKILIKPQARRKQ